MLESEEREYEDHRHHDHAFGEVVGKLAVVDHQHADVDAEVAQDRPHEQIGHAGRPGLEVSGLQLHGGDHLFEHHAVGHGRAAQ